MHPTEALCSAYSKLMKLTPVVIVILTLLPTSTLWSQSATTGAIAGRVTDSTGASVADSEVVLKGAESGYEQKTTTSATGDYEIPLVNPGNYILSVSKTGFRSSKTSLYVNLGTTTAFNMTLSPGTVGETIEVTGEAPLLQTEDANISTTFSTQQIREVPNPGGDITYIAQTAPGVVMNSNGFGYGNFSTFGLPGTSNLFTLNGNDYNDPFFNLNNSGASNLTLGSNELDEVSVTSNAYTAQYGRQAGTQVDYSTRSGTNTWHGNAVYYWTGRYLNANDPLNKLNGQPRPFENDNQYAASLGGPIIKSRLFFFANYEGLRYIFGTASATTTPTSAFEAATLANIPQDPATQAFYRNLFSLYNKAPGISAAQLNTGSCSAFNMPAALVTALGDVCTQTWRGAGSSGNHEYLFSTKIDYNATENDHFAGRMKFDRGVQPTYTDLINSAFNTFSTQPQDEGQLNYSHVFSPRMTNSFIGSVLYYSALFGTISPGSKALQLFPGNLVFPSGALTNLGFGSGGGGYAQAFYFPQGRNVTQWGLVDDLSITRGSHTFKLGVNFRRDDVGDHTPGQVAFYPAINATLPDFYSGFLSAASTTNYNFATRLAESEAFYSLGMYFQDEIHLTPRLKMIIAMRADRNSGGVCRGGCSSYPVNAFQDIQHGANIPYNQSFQTGNTTLAAGNEKVVFQPRFGLTYNPGGRNTVIRTGIGLFSDLYPATLLGPLDQNFPVVNLWNLPGAASGNTTLAWDLNPTGSTAFPNSGVQLVEQCNGLFKQNYQSGGNLNTYLAAAPGCGGGVPGLYDVTRNLKNPKYVEWNFEVQHSFGSNTVVSANYVGNRGFDELYRDPYLNAFGFGNLPATVPDPRVASVVQVQNGAISNYNGLTLSVVEKAWHGLSGRLNYTYSHALDDISNGGALPYAIFTSVGMIDPSNIRNDYGAADYDARHSITASYVYELPFKSGNRLKNAAIGGWQLSGTLFHHTGFPFTVVDGAQVAALANNNVTLPSLAGAIGTIVLQPEFAKRNFSNSDARNCAVAACFGVAGGLNATSPYLFAPATNFLGSVVGRNAFRGPGFLGGDISFRKNFEITERVDFQLGLNAYNFLNHANYGVPLVNTAYGSAFGLTTTTQFTPTSPYGAFATAATDMRIAQIQAKITF